MDMDVKEFRDLEGRLSKVEWTVEAHQQDLAEIKKQNASIDGRLGKIEQGMNRTQWIAIGASLVYFSDQMGLSSIFKLIGF
mgnify:CR=1 FL=1